MKNRIFIPLLVIASACCFSQDLPNGYDFRILGDFANPMQTKFMRNGDLMITIERRGLCWVSVLINGEYQKRAQPLFDIAQDVDVNFEKGLLSFDLNEDHLWFYYAPLRTVYGLPPGSSNYNPTQLRIERFDIDLDANEATNRTVIKGEDLGTWHVSARGNHCGGDLIIKNGIGYLPTGDGGQEFLEDNDMILAEGFWRPEEIISPKLRSQLLNSYAGKILRFDAMTGDALPDNPFYNPDDPNSAQSFVFALGLRNPWRMKSIPGQFESFIVSEVGEGKWEEFTRLIIGSNGGWGLYEASQEGSSGLFQEINPDEGIPFGDLLSQAQSWDLPADPAERRFIHKFPELRIPHHNNDSLSAVPYFEGSILKYQAIDNQLKGETISAGAFIQGNAFGEAYDQSFFFADFGESYIKYAPWDPLGNRMFDQVYEFSSNFTGGITDMIQHPNGSLIITSISGSIFEIYEDESLGIPDHVFYRDAKKRYFDILGREHRSLDRLPPGIYIIYYSLGNRFETKKHQHK